MTSSNKSFDENRIKKEIADLRDYLEKLDDSIKAQIKYEKNKYDYTNLSRQLYKLRSLVFKAQMGKVWNISPGNVADYWYRDIAKRERDLTLTVLEEASKDANSKIARALVFGAPSPIFFHNKETGSLDSISDWILNKLKKPLNTINHVDLEIMAEYLPKDWGFDIFKSLLKKINDEKPDETILQPFLEAFPQFKPWLVEHATNLAKIHHPLLETQSKLAVTHASLEETTQEQEFYLKAIKNANTNVDELLQAFGVLKNAGITVQSNKSFYEIVIRNIGDADKLALIFATLQEEGVTFQDNKYFYNILKNKNKFQPFYRLLAAGIQFHKEFYQHVLEKEWNIDILLNVIDSLQDIGITFKYNQKLYLHVIKALKPNEVIPNNILLIFKYLQDTGMSLYFDKELYFEVINNLHHLKTGNITALPQAFNILINAGINFQSNENLYLELIRNTSYADELLQTNEYLEKNRDFIFRTY